MFFLPQTPGPLRVLNQRQLLLNPRLPHSRGCSILREACLRHFPAPQGHLFTSLGCRSLLAGLPQCLFPPCSDSRLKLSQAQGSLSILETRQIQLECVVLNRTSMASQLVVEWFVWKPNHPEREVVAHLSRDATFHYGEQAAKNNLKGRLHVESPSSGVYRLFIQNVAVQDSGTYSCRVEEWLLSPSGVWYKRAEDTAGQTAVTVMRPGRTPRLPCFHPKNISDACIRYSSHHRDQIPDMQLKGGRVDLTV